MNSLAGIQGLPKLLAFSANPAAAAETRAKHRERNIFAINLKRYFLF